MNSQPTTEIARRGKHGRLLSHQRQSSSQSLLKTVTQLATEVEALQQRLAQIERSNLADPYHVPQSLAELGPRRLPPPGQTAMQAIQGKLEVDEPLEDLLAQLRANG